MTEDWSRRLAELRSEFDASFAEAPRVRPEMDDFLAVRVAGEPVALRLADVSRVGRTPKLVRVPTRRGSVLGVAALRGALLPVHSLAVLLGRKPGAHDWIASVHGAEAAVAFEDLTAFAQMPRGAVTDVLRLGDAAMPIIDLRALARSLTTGEGRQGD